MSDWVQMDQQVSVAALVDKLGELIDVLRSMADGMAATLPAGTAGEEVGGAGSANDQAASPTDEQVWVAVERRGIDFHAISGPLAERTECYRAASYGTILPRSRAEEFAKPCPRCYHSPAGAGVS